MMEMVTLNRKIVAIATRRRRRKEVLILAPLRLSEKSSSHMVGTCSKKVQMQVASIESV